MRVQTIFMAVTTLLLHACASQQKGCSVCGKTPAGAYRLLPFENLPRVNPDWGELRRAQEEGSTVYLCDACIRMRFENRLWTDEQLPQPHFRGQSGKLFGWW